MTTIPGGRRAKVARAVAKRGAQGMLVTNVADVRYLCGFTGSNAALALVGGRATLFTDGRYTVQAATEVDGAKVVIAEMSALVTACKFLVERGVERCGFDETMTTVSGLEGMRAALPAKVRKGWFVGVGPVVAGLREVKDEDEIGRMRRAAAGRGGFEGLRRRADRPGRQGGSRSLGRLRSRIRNSSHQKCIVTASTTR